MRIGIYASSMAVSRGYEDIVSGHVQVPLVTAKLLIEAGYYVELLTTEFSSDRVMPRLTPDSIKILQIPQFHLAKTAGGSRSISSLFLRLKSLLLASLSIKRLSKSRRYDVIHFFGANGTAELAGITRRIGCACPVVVTLNTGQNPGPSNKWRRWVWSDIDRILVTTDFFKLSLKRKGIESHKIGQGIGRGLDGMSDTYDCRKRVLFWREASPLNGGDIGVEVFRKLALRYPDIAFDFAIRPHPMQPPELHLLPQEIPNINVYTTPYEDGLTLEGLLDNTICVFQPFRMFTIQPQFSIVESMYAGVPVVAPDIESASELIESGKDGYLYPVGDTSAAIEAIEILLTNPDKTALIGRAAYNSSRMKWNWKNYPKQLISHYSALGVL